MDHATGMMLAMLRADPTPLLIPVAFLCGLLLGAEREMRGHRGMMRVCVMVCVAAAAFADLTVSRAEPGNWATGFGAIAQGVGFLGAGLILRDGVNVRGLSTAATLWCTAAAGAAAGGRELVLAGTVTAVALTANVVLRPVSRWVARNQRSDPADPMG